MNKKVTALATKKCKEQAVIKLVLRATMHNLKAAFSALLDDMAEASEGSEHIADALNMVELGIDEVTRMQDGVYADNSDFVSKFVLIDGLLSGAVAVLDGVPCGGRNLLSAQKRGMGTLFQLVELEGEVQP